MTLPAAFLAAQDAASEEAVFELSPFVVDATNDRGYTATSSLAGGRLSSDLRDTAAAVSVLTAEFLDDIGATNFLEAAKWAPNAVPVEEVEGASLYNDFSVQFRSLGSGFQSRNYFRWYINSDAYNTARIEFSRGPNSLVFGDAGVGGVANVSSIQARGTGVTSLQAQYNSFGGYRATVDSDLKVSDQLSVRIAGVYQRYDDWRNVGKRDRDGVFITGTYRITKRTELRAEAEWGRSDRLISFGILENYSGWDGETFIDEPIPLGTNLGVLRRENSDRLVFDASAPAAGIQNWKGLGATFGTFRMLTTYEQAGLPETQVLRSYKETFQAPNAGAENPYYTASLFFQHQFGDNLFLEVAGNYQEQERLVKRWFFDGLQVDVNRILPSGEPNPHVGELYGEARYWDNDQKNEVLDVRASLAYILNGDFSEQRFLLMTGHRDDRFENVNREFVRTNGSNPNVTASVNRIFARRYESDLGRAVTDPPLIDPGAGLEARYATTSASFSEKPITYFQGALISKWFKSRSLNTMLGVRRDRYKEEINERASDIIDPVSREFLGYGRKITATSQNVTNYNASAVYHLTDAFSVFAGYSESYDPGSTAIGINGSTLEALISNGKEAGIKLNLWNGRLVGSVTYYENEQENSRISGEAGAINNIWGLLDLDDRQVDTYRDRQSFSGTGWEFDFTAMPTDNWRLLFNIAFPDTELVDGLNDTRAYYNEHIDLWNSELARFQAEGQTLLADALANNISSIETRLASFEKGRRLDSTFRYTANVFSRYYITEGRLAGLSFGGGANLRGDRLAGNEPGDPFDYIYADEYVVYSLVAGYDFELRGTDLSLQVNVSNLFDREIVRPTRYGTYISGGEAVFTADRFNVQDPRQVLVTLSGRF
jgi:outer membrane receptor protein involved in Fe transport